jgi:MoaA/NifB/PqqE/SkfB family radical SAM enzyme
MDAKLQLKEIIWEITGKCKNGCKYCGSKDVSDVIINESNIIRIASLIALYPPKEINISGGDPLLVSLETHKRVVKILKDSNVRRKIIINPLSFKHENLTECLEILKLYDHIGISINSKDEMIAFEKYCTQLMIKHNCTIISNFNLQNLFDYEQIEKFVTDKNFIWQIQFTMFNDHCHYPLALYNPQNASALYSLSEKIRKSIKSGMRIVIADNANPGGCSAGIHSLGILYNGDVVPCLSMRSWKFSLKHSIVENVLSFGEYSFGEYELNPLKTIWIEKFNKYRFNSFRCCKDQCNRKIIDTSSIEITKHDADRENMNNYLEELQRTILPVQKPIRVEPGVMMYGVVSEQTIMYGVNSWQTETH